MKTLHSYARFSTIGQDEKHGGDSERRQIEDAKSFAKRHGFTLSNLTLIDRGRGAFKGNKQGARRVPQSHQRRNGEIGRHPFWSKISTAFPAKVSGKPRPLSIRFSPVA